MKERQRGGKIVPRIDPSHHEKAPPEGRCRLAAVDLTATMNDELRRPWVEGSEINGQREPGPGLLRKPHEHPPCNANLRSPGVDLTPTMDEELRRPLIRKTEKPKRCKCLWPELALRSQYHPAYLQGESFASSAAALRGAWMNIGGSGESRRKSGATPSGRTMIRVSAKQLRRATSQ